jgi:hypothetical protein
LLDKLGLIYLDLAALSMSEGLIIDPFLTEELSPCISEKGLTALLTYLVVIWLIISGVALVKGLEFEASFYLTTALGFN